MTAREIASRIIFDFDHVVFYYFIFVNGIYTLLLILSIPEMIANSVVARDGNINNLFTSAAPGISLIAPAHNMAEDLSESLRAMLTLEYPALEVIVVNDGSTDDTIEKLRREFQLYEVPPIFRRLLETKPVRAVYRSTRFAGLTVVDKENGGKADALNAGLNIAKTPLFCALDADTIIEPDALLKLARSFLMKNNVIAMGGTIRIANGCRIERGRVVEVRPPRSYLVTIQVVEYLRAFLFGRMGLNRLGGNLIVSGAFGLFDRETVISVGGYAGNTVGEDMELVVRMHRKMRESRRPYRIEFIPDPVAWTEAPETVKVLARQRERWHRGLADTLMRHKKMLLNPRYGAIGLIVFPYFFFVELLVPLVEVLGYVAFAVSLYFDIVGWFFAGLFFIAAYGFGVVLSLTSIVLEEAYFQRYPKFRHVMRLVAFGMLENTSYRFMTVFWRFKGLVQYVRGDKSWGGMERYGFRKNETPGS